MRRALLVLCIAAAPAHADDRDPRAKAYVDSANAHYRAGEYDAAIAELRAAYAIRPDPALLYAWAQAERKLGDCREAVRLYQEFLAHDVAADQATAARANIARCPIPPEPRIGSQPQQPAPAPAPRLPWYRDTTGDALVGGGLVATGTSLALFVISHDLAQQSQGARDVGAYGSAIDRAVRDREIAIGSLVAGIGLAGAGITHYVLHERRLEVSGFVHGGGGGLTVAARF
jgi:tetratricopeptide (TPR) repeat protein